MTNLAFPFSVSGKLLRHLACEGGFLFAEEISVVGSFGGFLLRTPQTETKEGGLTFFFEGGEGTPMQL